MTEMECNVEESSRLRRQMPPSVFAEHSAKWRCPLACSRS